MQWYSIWYYNHFITSLRGTGMVASSSTFRTHLWRVIRDLSRLLHVALHGTEALVYSNYPRKAAAYTWLAMIWWRIASGEACFLHSIVVPMQLRISAGTDVGHARALNYRQYCLTLDLSRGMNGVTLNNDSVSALNCISKPKSTIVLACPGVNPLDMPRTSGSSSPCPITPPSRHNLYIGHQWTSMDCIVFYRTTISLKWPLVPSDVGIILRQLVVSLKLQTTKSNDTQYNTAKITTVCRD